ncbi:MAG: hypothetical protein LUE25_03705 [Clostridiales bacterium]|nr:hypothetical protein [Clostridiales bacterium]
MGLLLIYLLVGISILVIAGYFLCAEGSFGKGICFALIVLFTSFVVGIEVCGLFASSGGGEAGSIAAVSVVGAFLGYAIMRNSSKNGKNDDEKDKK